MKKQAKYKKLLSLLIKSKNIREPLKRRLYILAVISKALEPFDIKPILIGGGAVEYYTFGGYTTQDIDIAIEEREILDQVLKNLGFKKEGRYWFRNDLGALIEAPAGDISLQGETAPLSEVRIGNLRCYIIGIEDLIIDRLNGFAHWGWKDDLRWAKEIAKNHTEQINWKYLRKRAKEEKVDKALKKLK